jgi:hypothetical protein
MDAPLYKPHSLNVKATFDGLLKPKKAGGLKIAALLGLVKVADNLYECKSTKDLWRVDGNRLFRTSSDEVDNGESTPAADAKAPDVFLAKLLEELDF